MSFCYKCMNVLPIDSIVFVEDGWSCGLNDEIS